MPIGDENMKTCELKKQLYSQYKYRIEMHAHTSPVSSCSEIPPKQLVDIYKPLGFDAVVITNHFEYNSRWPNKEEYIKAYINDYEQAKQYGQEQGLKVYLGAEIRFTECNNDYLIFGVDRQMLSEIYDLLPYGVENFRKSYLMPDSLFIQAHPFRDGMKLVDPSLLDGVEVFNMHPNHNSRVGFASIYARENNLSIITSGSDFHHPNKKHEGIASLRSATLPKDSFELASILKGGDYLLEVGKSNIIIP